MKKLLSVLLATVMVVSVGCSKTDDTKGPDKGSAEITEKGDSSVTKFKGSAKGHNGEDIIVEVEYKDGKILAIDVDASSETEGLGVPAAEKVAEAVVDNQTLNVDVVSGATVSSEATLAAITAALTEAGADIDAFKKGGSASVKSEDISDMDTEIVIVGAGGAGLSAAVEAATNGKNVVIVEKMEITGGNTSRATGGLNAAETKYQEKSLEERAEKAKEDGKELQGPAARVDTKARFFTDTMSGGHDKNNPDLVRTLVENSAGAVDWINDLAGDMTKVGMFGGATAYRIHKPTDNSAVGPQLMKTLIAKVESLDNIKLYTGVTATELIVSDDTVTGIKAETKDGKEITINAKAVILATGGFSANKELVGKYQEEIKDYQTTNHAGATGDGIILAEKVNADLVDMVEIQLHPTPNAFTAKLYTEAVRGDGAILVNKEGQRFIHELEARDVVAAAIFEQTDRIAFTIVDQAMVEKMPVLKGYIEKAKDEEQITTGATLEELAKNAGIDPEGLKATMEKYAEYFDNGKDPEFSRLSFEQRLDQGPFYSLPVAPAIHHTMGGIKIDTATHVINTDGEIVKGLYAAGEVAGGVHGGNRLGGNAVADIVVFGRIAGQTAAAEVESGTVIDPIIVETFDEEAGMKEKIKEEKKAAK